jgi:hypothetical protein
MMGRPDDGVVLSTAQISVTVLPGNGADLVSIVDIASGVDVLFRTPWAAASAAAVAWDSLTRWLATYQGGWQVLCPNAGTERTVAGALLGFHGEASMVPWIVDEVTETALTCHLTLFTAPFRMKRVVRVFDRTVAIDETVENTSSDDHELIWMHHPGFGSPLVSASAELDLPGGVLLADRESPPGFLLEAGSKHDWPFATTFEGDLVDLRRLPGPDQPRGLLAGVDRLPAGWFAIRNPELGLGVAMHWDVEVFPHLWLWQEVHHSEGFPWFRRAYVVAAEPSNVMTDQRPASGPMPTLKGGEKRSTTLEMTLFQPSGPVTDVEPGGQVVMVSR